MIAAPINSGFILSDDPATPKTDATVSFRDIIPKPDHPRIAGIHTHDAVSWCQSRREVPAPAWLINRLDMQNIERPYKGFSADGNPDPSVVRYEADEGAPVQDAVRAVEAFLDGVPESLRSEAIKGDVEKDDEFRAWSNPELYVNPGKPIIVLRRRCLVTLQAVYDWKKWTKTSKSLFMLSLELVSPRMATGKPWAAC